MDISELQSQYIAYYTSQLENIADDIEEILQDAIQTNVYDYYKPSWYERTNSLKDSIRSEVKNVNGIPTLYVYIDTDLLNYNSAYDSKNVSTEVPFWIESGHNARNYLPTNSNGEQFYNEFHAYEGRRYLEEAYEEINRKYGSMGLNINIINDNPSNM
jgi:hypothetical protein